MCNIIGITNRNLVNGDFLLQIEKLATAKPKAIILREKDLTEEEYKKLAIKVLAICEIHNVKCILHNFPNVARELECKNLHLPLGVLRLLSEEERKYFSTLGASCHSIEEAKEAERLGCSYILAGHIFETDCKKGLEGRGLGFLNQVVNSVNIPVYGLGGINATNYKDILNTGAKGAAIMSGFMKCENPSEYMKLFNEVENEI